MAAQYTREHLKVCVAKTCLTIGWHTSMTTPIEILTDILQNYLFQLSKATHEYANGFGMTTPNLDHLGLAFRDFHINLSELEEYVRNVDFIESPLPVPKYPIPKEDHLNFLKPGSKEVVTRQVHIHEHLPPMHPVLEATEIEADLSIKKEKEELIDVENTNPVFKRPAEVSPGEIFKRPRLLLEEEGRPTREISSVMMTTSGFLSPAREGKLPESRSPMPALDPIAPPQTVNQPLREADVKKPIKLLKKVEKRRDKIGKELFKPSFETHQSKKTNVKEIVKSKMKMAQHASAAANNFMVINEVKISLLGNNKSGSSNHTKFNKDLAAARLKTEKLNTTITPIPPKVAVIPPTPPVVKTEPHVDKLLTEPDKRKINILKKISVKNEKLEKFLKIKDEIKQESRESSPDLIIDESANEAPGKVHHLSNDITIELINSTTKSPEKVERSYFDDDSPPGTPSTPKTPEMISQSPPLNKTEKRKRKDKSKVKKFQKQISPARLDHEPIDLELERPKTPEAAHLIVKHEKPDMPTPPLPFPFFSPFAGPGLIPTPLSNPLFQHLPIPPLGIPGFGQPAYMPPVHPGMPLNFIPPLKPEEHSKSPVEKVVPSISIPVLPEKDLPSPKSEKKSKEHKKEKKDKLKKKSKKDKTKNKSEKKKLKEEKREKVKKEKKEKKKEKEIRDAEITIPKLTLKLGSASPHPELQDTRKLTIKPILKKEEEPTVTDTVREMSPELAKISALVTGQPKPKSTTTTVGSITDNIPSSSTDSHYLKKSMFKPIPKLRTKEIRKDPTIAVDLYNTTPSSYIEETVKEEVPPVHTVPSPRSAPGPGRPRIHPIKAKSTKFSKQQRQGLVKDSEGNKVWICPACGKQDDGSPMIGCDDCDAWYHWVCVGIQVPPDDSEDWYCRLCISKKQEVLQSDKKKKRKKREKKEH